MPSRATAARTFEHFMSGLLEEMPSTKEVLLYTPATAYIGSARAGSATIHWVGRPANHHSPNICRKALVKHLKVFLVHVRVGRTAWQCPPFWSNPFQRHITMITPQELQHLERSTDFVSACVSSKLGTSSGCPGVIHGLVTYVGYTLSSQLTLKDGQNL